MVTPEAMLQNMLSRTWSRHKNISLPVFGQRRSNLQRRPCRRRIYSSQCSPPATSVKSAALRSHSSATQPGRSSAISASGGVSKYQATNDRPMKKKPHGNSRLENSQRNAARGRGGQAYKGGNLIGASGW